MKRIILFIAFVVLGTTAITAQERDQDRIQDQDRTNLMMVNGQMIEVRNRAHVRLNEPLTLNDGTVITPKGTYTTKDGKQLRLRNGECLDSDGVKYRNEYQYRYKIMQENKGLTQAQVQERNQNRIHYTLVDGEMLQIRTQAQNRLERQVNLANGGTLNPDGTYQTRERKQLRLLDGQCLNMDGELYQNQYQYRQHLAQVQNNMRKNKVQKKVATKKSVGKKSTIKKNKGKKKN